MISAHKISATVPVYGLREEWVSDESQNVPLIAKSLLKRHNLDKTSYDKFSDNFWTGDVKTTGKKLFRFCKDNVYYKVESEIDQTVKTPGRLLKDGHGDCKHYSLFIVGVADSLARKGYPIKANYRFVSDIPGHEVHHVFAVLKDKEGNEFWVDPVIDFFNERPTFYNTKDMAVSSLSGTFKNAIPVVVGHNKFYFTPDQVKALMQARNVQFSNPQEVHQFLKSELTTYIGKTKKKAGHKGFIKAIAHGMQVNAANAKKEVKKDVHNAAQAVKKDVHNAAKAVKKEAQKVKTLALKVSFAAGRGPFLALVDMNAFNWAHHLRDELMSAGRNALLSKWKSIGGNDKQLINAVNNGYREYKKHHGGYNIAKDRVNGIGVVQVAALLALASGIAGILARFLHNTPAEQAQIANYAHQGIANLAMHANAGINTLDQGAEGAAAISTILDKNGAGSMDVATGVDDNGDPVMNVTGVSSPAISDAGAAMSNDEPDAVPGGGDVNNPDNGGMSTANPNNALAASAGGGKLSAFVHDVTQAVKDAKPWAITAGAGLVAVSLANNAKGRMRKHKGTLYGIGAIAVLIGGANVYMQYQKEKQ